MPRGEKPKPSAIKIMEGNRSKVARDSIGEDPQGVGRPRVPSHLTADERKLWADVVASLPVGLLTLADEAVLERMAVAWARFRAANKTIASTGLMVQSPNGPVRNPLIVILNAAAKEMHAAGSELGLSPVARARLAAPNAGDDDPMSLLLGMDNDPDGAWSTASKTRN